MDIKELLDKVYRPVYKIEADLGMPKTTLQKSIKGKRVLPKKWADILSDYVKSGEWILANVRDNNKPNNKERILEERKAVAKLPKTPSPLLEKEAEQIPPMPTRNDGENVFDFAARKNEWKKLYQK